MCIKSVYFKPFKHFPVSSFMVSLKKSPVSHSGFDVSESIKGRMLQLRLVILLLQLVNVPYNKNLGPELINHYQPFRLPGVVSKLVTTKFFGYRLHPLTRIDHLSQPCAEIHDSEAMIGMATSKKGTFHMLKLLGVVPVPYPSLKVSWKYNRYITHIAAPTRS